MWSSQTQQIHHVSDSRGCDREKVVGKEWGQVMPANGLLNKEILLQILSPLYRQYIANQIQTKLISNTLVK
ncbi:hypothetical protein ACFL1R_06265 [Candidatus Latescibacterota bacterium]